VPNRTCPGLSGVRVVLVQREVESGRSPLSEYNAHFGEPVWEDISQRTGGWWTRRRLKLQLVSKKRKTRWVVRVHTARR
jgi:hypothetical protein